MVKKADKSGAKKLIVLDSHAIIHRAYHALPEFANSKGEPTGALYGLSTMLMKIIADLKPDYIVAAYDLPGKTFRHEAYDAYKAGRVKADSALVDQLKSSRKIFDAFSIPIYDAPGFEADDIIGTVVEKVKSQMSKVKCDVIIASGDMDTMQLVDGERVKVFTLKKGLNDTILYDEKAVRERFGFGPELLPDYKGLRGDPSDNIVGVKGIGEKTATSLIVKYGTIENIYLNLKSLILKPKNKDELKKIGITERIISLLIDNEEEALFSKTLATIRRDAPIDFRLPEKPFLETVDMEKITALFRELEFRSLTERARKLFSSEEKLEAESKQQEASSAPASDESKKLFIALWLLNSDLTNPTQEDIENYGKEKILADIKERGLPYVYEDIELAIMPIVDAMEKTGIKIDTAYLKKLSADYHKELSALEKNIWKMAGREFNINSPKQLGEIIFDEMKVGEGAGLRMKKTAGGARSTRESELEKLRGLHPIVDQIFKHRELQKLLSTYIDVIPSLVGSDGRLHAKLNQAGTTTGRFSSKDPNIQNIPIKTELGKNIRRAFVAPAHKKLISFDYSQIELRVAALMSEDDFMIKVFEDGKDIHAAVASKVFGVPEKEVTHEMRRRAKVINFGILYGMGVTALQQNLGTDRKVAQEFYDNYFLQFPAIEGYLESVKDFAKKTGYTETLFGRRRYFPGLKSKLPFIRASAERMAINAPLQGTAADCIKIAIRDADRALSNERLAEHAKLILQVHDELVYEVDDDAVEKVSVLVENTMKNVLPRDFLKNKKPVPLEVHVSVGQNWQELK